MGPLEVQPLRINVEREVMAMKGYSTFSRAPGLEPHYQDTRWRKSGLTHSAELKSAYSTAIF